MLISFLFFHCNWISNHWTLFSYFLLKLYFYYVRYEGSRTNYSVIFTNNDENNFFVLWKTSSSTNNLILNFFYIFQNASPTFGKWCTQIGAARTAAQISTSYRRSIHIRIVSLLWFSLILIHSFFPSSFFLFFFYV